ncbi:putative protein tyrosine kinase [Lyophyllum shimeji]|uniref:Protein kinase domain-containing protein n=1 Tax=Lyophyllum shimeji TaxID=47721 RepID=A0A9P3UTH5_LYOSH|nr:putative protein tyrosine kinase [Lyophyllum shimeji]
MLLIGIYLYGFGDWEAVQKDPKLGLAGKLARRGDYLLNLLWEHEEGASKVTPLVARLQVLFENKEEYRQLLARRDSNAQRLLDMFQRLLDILKVPSPSFHRSLIVATQRLAAKSGLYPACYELTDVTTIGDRCESAGGFADIYKGSFQGRVVCVKTIRLDKKTQVDHLLKLCPLLLEEPSNCKPCSADVAEGLWFLHRTGIIHGDLKGANILIKESGRACIADFGISSIADRDILAWTTHSSAASKGGTVRWQAPEVFNPEGEDDIPNTVASDVYAWSCVVYEIFTEQVPFAHLQRDAAVMFKVSGGERPTRPPQSSPSWSAWGLTEDIWTLMEDCSKSGPEDRLTTDEIIEHLERTAPEDTRMGESDSTLSPAEVREITRQGLEHDELSVETLESLLDASYPLPRGL